MIEQLKTDRVAQLMLVGLIITICFACCSVGAFGYVLANRQNAKPQIVAVSSTATVITDRASSPTSAPPTVILPEAPEPTATSTTVVPATPYDGPTNAYQPVATNTPVDSATTSDTPSGPVPRLKEISPWDDGGYGMYFDIPPTITRKALLAFGYETAREVMYGDDPPPYVTIHLQFEDHLICNMGLGIGQSSLAKYLPTTRPADLESWFAQLVQSRYYGDEPGQSIYLIAYGNDAANKPLCDLGQLKY